MTAQPTGKDDRVSAFITGPLAQAIDSFGPTPSELVSACAAVLRLKSKTAPSPDAASAFVILSEEVSNALDRAAQRIAKNTAESNKG